MSIQKKYGIKSTFKIEEIINDEAYTLTRLDIWMIAVLYDLQIAFTYIGYDKEAGMASSYGLFENKKDRHILLTHVSSPPKPCFYNIIVTKSQIYSLIVNLDNDICIVPITDSTFHSKLQGEMDKYVNYITFVDTFEIKKKKIKII